MTRLWLLGIGITSLALLWLGPLPRATATSFSAHMLLHMGVVAIAAPLLAMAVSGTAIDPAARRSAVTHPITASIAELVVVWGWHAPLFHLAARQQPAVLAAEQASFLVAGLWLWLAAFGGGRSRAPWTGVAALLFTSIHMTLLAAIFALAPRDVYGHAGGSAGDQHLGGSLMLLIGGGAYLAGGLWLAWQGLAGRPAVARRPA
jgi:putative membrane protein